MPVIYVFGNRRYIQTPPLFCRRMTLRIRMIQQRCSAYLRRSSKKQVSSNGGFVKVGSSQSGVLVRARSTHLVNKLRRYFQLYHPY